MRYHDRGMPWVSSPFTPVCQHLCVSQECETTLIDLARQATPPPCLFRMLGLAEIHHLKALGDEMVKLCILPKYIDQVYLSPSLTHKHTFMTEAYVLSLCSVTLTRTSLIMLTQTKDTKEQGKVSSNLHHRVIQRYTLFLFETPCL